MSMMLCPFIATLAAQTLDVVHRFQTDGGAYGRLIQATDGNFYGTTNLGGANGVGTIFKMSASGTLTTLHSFGYTEGANPKAALLQGADGNFYGTASAGGASTARVKSASTMAVRRLLMLCILRGQSGERTGEPHRMVGTGPRQAARFRGQPRPSRSSSTASAGGNS